MTKRAVLGVGGWLLLALFACGQFDPEIGPARNSLELRFGIRMFDRGEVGVLSGTATDLVAPRTGNADLSIGFSHRIDSHWIWCVRAAITGVPASFRFRTSTLVDTTGTLIFDGGTFRGPINEMGQLAMDIEVRRTLYDRENSALFANGGVSMLYNQAYRLNYFSSYYEYASPLLYTLNAITNGSIRPGLSFGLRYELKMGKRSGLTLDATRSFIWGDMYTGTLTIAPASLDRTVATVTQPSGNWLFGIGYRFCLDKRPPKQPLEYGSR
jgi:hypothetical protein